MRRTLFIITLILYFGCSRSQNTLEYCSSTTGAACFAIKYYNGYVFTGTGSTLRSYYVGNGANVPYDSVFEYRYISQIIRLAVHDHYLYVAANYDGMTKWDISDPAHPVKVFDIFPDSTDMATQAIAFKGDTIFLAQQTKVSAYKDNGSTYSKIADFGYAPFAGIISGVAVKGNLLAYTVWQVGGQNGVYLYDVNDFSFISFTQHSGYFTENVIWGKNNDLLHVMGGTNTTNGHFYTLNVSDPISPQLVFSDTVLGFPYGAAMALPYNAENINDTIYVANWGGLKPGDIGHCYIRAYDATDTSNVHFLNYIIAGLWHFDLTVSFPKLYVASEWYGIKTVDITDIMNPVDEGNTLTGGWDISADAWGNYMTVANEGYGFKLYDISNPYNSTVLQIKNDPGFCTHANFSEDGQYIYASNMTTQPLRVYQRNSLTQTGFISQAVNNGRFIVHHSRIFSELDDKILILDVSDPYSPFIDSTVNIVFNDMAVSGEQLFVTTNDSIFVYDISGTNFSRIVSLPMAANQDAQMLAAYNNKIYVYISNKGLTQYTLEFNNPSYSLAEDYSSALTNGAPTFIAADTFGIYLAYRLKGLYALDRQTFAQTGYYRGGLDYRKYTTMYGVQDLFCKENKIFYVEYFSQTSVLTNDTLSSELGEIDAIKDKISVYPNPATAKLCVSLTDPDNISSYQFMVYNINGQISKWTNSTSDYVELDISDLAPGMYLLYARKGLELMRPIKFIKQ